MHCIESGATTEKNCKVANATEAGSKAEAHKTTQHKPHGGCEPANVKRLFVNQERQVAATAVVTVSVRSHEHTEATLRAVLAQARDLAVVVHLVVLQDGKLNAAATTHSVTA